MALIVFSVKVTAESSTGFPPSPGFPESSAAKELSGLDDVLSIYFLVVTGNLSDEHWLHWLGFYLAVCCVRGFVSLCDLCVFWLLWFVQLSGEHFA